MKVFSFIDPVLEGDFLAGYFRSFGNVGFLRGARGLLDGFVDNLRNQLDYVPGGSSVDEEESSMTATGNANVTDGSGFNAFQFINDVMNALENLAANELGGGQANEAATCIRQVIEVQKRTVHISYSYNYSSLCMC